MDGEVVKHCKKHNVPSATARRQNNVDASQRGLRFLMAAPVRSYGRSTRASSSRAGVAYSGLDAGDFTISAIWALLRNHRAKSAGVPSWARCEPRKAARMSGAASASLIAALSRSMTRRRAIGATIPNSGVVGSMEVAALDIDGTSRQFGQRAAEVTASGASLPRDCGSSTTCR